MLVWRWLKSVIAGWRFNINASRQEVAWNSVLKLRKETTEEVLRYIQSVLNYGNKALKLESAYIADGDRQSVENINLLARDRYYRTAPAEDTETISQIRQWLALPENKGRPEAMDKLLTDCEVAKSNLGVNSSALKLLYGTHPAPYPCARPIKLVMLDLAHKHIVGEEAERKLSRIADLAKTWIPALFSDKNIAA